MAGAVDGAYAGLAIEGNPRAANHVEVPVRFENGATQTVSFANDPSYQIGDKVKVNDRVIVRNP